MMERLESTVSFAILVGFFGGLNLGNVLVNFHSEILQL